MGNLGILAVTAGATLRRVAAVKLAHRNFAERALQ